MEHVSSVHPTGKFPEKVENLKRWSRFPGWNLRTECRVPFTFPIVCTSSRSTVGHRDVPGLRPNGTTFYQSEIPLLLPPKFPGFFPKWKAPDITVLHRVPSTPGHQQHSGGLSPFLVWGDFHARSLFARSIIPEDKWGTTHSLNMLNVGFKF